MHAKLLISKAFKAHKYQTRKKKLMLKILKLNGMKKSRMQIHNSNGEIGKNVSVKLKWQKNVRKFQTKIEKKTKIQKAKNLERWSPKHK